MPVKEDKARSMIVAKGESLGRVGGEDECWREVRVVTFVTFAA